jgi:ribosomal protein S8
MITTKFRSDIFSLIQISYKRKDLWLDCFFSKNGLAILQILKKNGIISSYVIYNNNKKKKIRIFLKYINLQNSLLAPISLYLKSSLKISIRVISLKKIIFTTSYPQFIISTSKGLLDINDCLTKKLGGSLAFILYVFL